MLTYDSQDKNWAIFCHLGGFAGYIIPFGNIIVPLVLWLIKRDESPFVNQHGKEALNFNISLTIYAIITGLLCFILIGFILIPVLVILQIVCTIKASMCASRGEYYHYPMTIRLIS